MKNTKRILAVVIALTMVIGMFASVSAASGEWYSKAVTYLEAAGIAKIGTKAETKLTRAEFVLWVAKLEAGANFVESGMWKKDGLDDVIVFSDVDTSVDGIYRSAINYCYQRHFVRGNGDGTFSPDAKVTLAQASAVIVRLMGYENKVTNLEDWQYNYFNVANNYCNAFDKEFANHLPAVDAEYELTYGEAAYLLATILNWGAAPTDPSAIAQLSCLTAEGENLGEKFPAGSLNASSQIAIVSGVDFVKVYYDLYGATGGNGTGKIYAINNETGDLVLDADGNPVLTIYDSDSNGMTLNYGYSAAKSASMHNLWTKWGLEDNEPVLDFVTNVIDPDSSVTLNLIGENGLISNKVTVSVATLQQLVRVSLGKSKNVDKANGEIFNLGDYINNGSVMGVEVSGKTVTSVTVATEDAGTRLVSDTFLVVKTTGEKWVRNPDGTTVRYGRYPYLANAEGSSLDKTPQLLTSYTDAKKVSVSGSKLTLGETTYSIVQTRTVGEKEIVVYDVSADVLAPLSASTVAARIPNTAAGEHDVEFTDVDGDGFFDVAVIRDYSTFKYVDKTNADPAPSSSVAKYNQGGAVVIDKKVTKSENSDGWKYDSGTSGKIQLVVMASNKHNAVRTQYYDGEYKVTETKLDTNGNPVQKVDDQGEPVVDADGNPVYETVDYYYPLTYPMHYYTVVDIADLTTAYIESVEKDLVTSGDKTYYVATLVNVADGSKAKVLVPTKSAYADTRTNVKVEIAGQSTTVSVYSGDWMTFLATEEAARANGIDQIVNEENTGSWLVDKTVKYATKGAVSGATGLAADMVCVMLGTTSEAAQGFIVDVAKTETGDNTYNVTIAKSGNALAELNWVNALDAYFTYGKTNGYWAGFDWSFYRNYPYHAGTTETMRTKMGWMGFTDPDAWVASDWAKADRDLTGVVLHRITGILRTLTPNMDDATILDSTLESLATNTSEWVQVSNANTDSGTGYAKFTVASSVYDILKYICKPAGINLYNMDSDDYIRIEGGTLSDGGVINADSTKEGWVAAPTKDYADFPAEALALTLRDVLDMIPGFDADTYFANLTVYKDKNIQTNAFAYWYFLMNIADMVRGGTFEKSNVQIGYSNEFGGGTNKDGSGKNLLTTQKGYFTSLISCKGATSVATYEVRASASSIWDWDNYSVYYGIFAGQTLKEHEGSTDAVTGQDLTYVSIKKDAANTAYVLQYLDETSDIYAEPKVGGTNGWSYSYTSNEYSGTLDVKCSNWSTLTGWNKGAMTYQLMIRNEASYWDQYAQEIILTDVNKELAKITAPGERELVLEIATNPYYKKVRSTNGDVTSFERHWTVGQYTVTVTTSYASGDPLKTYIPVVDINGEQIKVTTQAEKDEWENQTTVDLNGVVSTFEVNDKGLLFKVNTRIPEYKYDANGNKVLTHTYDFESMTAVDGSTPTDKVVDEDGIVGLIKIEEMTNRKETGYFPGAYKVEYDGKTYIAAGETPVVIMTPNFKTGDLDGKATTVEALAEAKSEVFVTYAQVAATDTSLNMLSVIGELVDKTAAPTTTVTEKTYLVYLAHDGVTIEALENGKYFVVRSTYSASEIPSCEDFGSIYRKYSTYTEAKYAESVDVAISTGYYTVKEDGEIVKSASVTKKGEITEVDSVGNVKATLDGKKVDATGYKWTFIYEDFNGNIHVAGSATNVSIASKADVLKTLESAEKALADAEKDYADAKSFKLSAEIQATLKAVVDEKAAALETAKTNAIAKYLDGQFWGGANSSVYRYINSYRYTYQKEPSPVTFQYTVIDGTYVVFVNSFFA